MFGQFAKSSFNHLARLYKYIGEPTVVRIGCIWYNELFTFGKNVCFSVTIFGTEFLVI